MLRNNAALHKLVALGVAIALNTAFWAIILTVGCYAFGITISTPFLVGFVLPIPVASAVVLLSVIGLGSDDASRAYTPSRRRKKTERAREVEV